MVGGVKALYAVLLALVLGVGGRSRPYTLGEVPARSWFIHQPKTPTANRSVQFIIHGFLMSSIPLINDRPTVALKFSFSVPSSISVSNSRTSPVMDPLAAE